MSTDLFHSDTSLIIVTDPILSLQEQQEMLSGGFKTQCNMLEEEIARLREENTKPQSLMGEILTSILPGALGRIVKKVLL